MKKSKTLLALEKLAQDENKFLANEFVAPRLQGQKIGVKIGQTVCSMRIAPRNYQGWGRFRPVDFRFARLVGPATEDERERYLRLLPSVRMLIAGRDDDGFLAVPAYEAEQYQLTGPARLHFADGLELFDCVVARYDGQQFLYDSQDNRRSPIFADTLRTHLAALDAVIKVDMAGLLPEERWLYDQLVTVMANEAKEAAERERKSKAEYRIADALAHAGAVMRSYIERNDGYMVEFTLNGHRHTSFVDKNLQVHSAGLCLSGRDHDYDLASLVSVIREGQERGAINRTRVNPDRRGENNEYRYEFGDDDDDE